MIRSPVQRGGPIDLRGVHVDAGVDERANASLVVLLGGVGERRPDGGGRETDL